MSSFKFNDIYSRLSFLEGAKTPLGEISTAFGTAQGKYRQRAAAKGASTPTREAKNTLIDIITVLLQQHAEQSGEEMDMDIERALRRFKNISAQGPLIAFLRENELIGTSLADIVATVSLEEIEAIADDSGKEDTVEWGMRQRKDDKLSKYKLQAQQRAEAKLAREEAQKAKAAQKAALEAGESGLADSLGDIAAALTPEEEMIGSLEDAVSDPTYFIEIRSTTPNKPVMFHIKQKVGGYANEDGVEVSGNSVQFSADPDSPIAQAIMSRGVWAVEQAIKNDLRDLAEVAVVIMEPETLPGDEPEDIRAAMKQPVIDQGKPEVRAKSLDDEIGPSSTELAGMSMEDNETVGLSIWDLSPEQVSELAAHMAADDSITDVYSLIETMASEDVSPDEVEAMLGEEANMLFGNEEDEEGDYDSFDEEDVGRLDSDDIKTIRRKKFKGSKEDNKERLDYRQLNMIHARNQRKRAKGGQEPLAKDTDDARDKGGKLYQGNRHGQYNKITGKWVSNHERMLNRKSSKSENEETVTESYTSSYMSDQVSKDTRNVQPINESVSFREQFKPKTSDQLAELRRYGL